MSDETEVRKSWVTTLAVAQGVATQMLVVFAAGAGIIDDVFVAMSVWLALTIRACYLAAEGDSSSRMAWGLALASLVVLAIGCNGVGSVCIFAWLFPQQVEWPSRISRLIAMAVGGLGLAFSWLTWRTWQLRPWRATRPGIR